MIGVLPASFKFLRTRPAIVLPMPLDVNAPRFISFGFQALARMKPGVSLAQANADVARMISLLPPTFARLELRPNVRPLATEVVGNVGQILWILLAAVGVVLLIACGNVANLFLVRAEGRHQELAVRATLGASRGRIARALLSESVVLALTGGLFLRSAPRVSIPWSPCGLRRSRVFHRQRRQRGVPRSIDIKAYERHPEPTGLTATRSSRPAHASPPRPTRCATGAG